jgi:hypothetical protein
VSLIAVNNIIVVTYCSKCHRLSLSLIAVNGITVMDKPYQQHYIEDMTKKWLLGGRDVSSSEDVMKKIQPCKLSLM